MRRSVLEFCTFASGSKGNCTLVRQGSTYILLDAGISMRRIQTALRALGVELARVAAIVLTHEHADHVSGLAMLQKHTDIPVYASEGTARELERGGRAHALRRIPVGVPFAIGDLELCAFETLHDTAQSVGYVLSDGKRKLALATDLGRVTAAVVRACLGVDAAIVESNHDLDMLWSGAYPYPLKRRIAGDYGHLSNAAGAAFALQLAQAGARCIALAHLSRDNNSPDLAMDCARGVLQEAGVRVGQDVCLRVSPAETMGEIYAI